MYRWRWDIRLTRRPCRCPSTMPRNFPPNTKAMRLFQCAVRGIESPHQGMRWSAFVSRTGGRYPFEPFVTGFVTPKGEYGRLAGNAIAQDGSLLFTDDRNGMIYRVSYIGNGGRAQTHTVPGASMLHQAQSGVKSDLAIACRRPRQRPP